jgi:hypothetical protein
MKFIKMKSLSLVRLLVAAALLLAAKPVIATDFKAQVVPVLKQYCYKCHSNEKKSKKGKLVLDDMANLADKISPNGIIKPGNAAQSSFYGSMKLPATDDDHMPPKKEPQPTPAQMNLIMAWINEGASLDGKTAAAPAAPATPGAPAAPAAGAAAMATWTSADGKTIQASFLRLEGENVVIQREDGEAFIVPLSKLSAES